MDRRLFSVAAAVAAVALVAACSDDSPPSAPQSGPSFAQNSSPPVCAFNGNPSLSNAINTYFTVASEKSQANAYASAIQTAYNTPPAPNFTAARAPGFDLLKYVGTVARAGHGSSPADGAAVIQQTIQCMYNVPAGMTTGGDFEGWPTSTQFDFASALSFASGGAYFVRGDATKDALTAPVVAELAGFDPVTDGNVSAIGPAATSDWPTSLGQRVLIYGNLYPTPNAPTGYDWKFIPRNVTFNPNGVVALCNGLAGSSDLKINQAGLGVLAFQEAAGLCGSSVVALQGRSLLQRMSQFAMTALSPSPAYATTLLTSTGGGLGGAKGDPFIAVPVTSLNVEWYQKPPSVVTVNTAYTAIGAAWTYVNGVKTYVNGACLYITVTNNNGTGTQANGSKDCGTPSDIQVSAVTTFRNPPNKDPGYATFNIIVTKTGGVIHTLSAASLAGTGNITSNNTVTSKGNVRPQ
jgi:hypothetical protein